ncbi:hypothetical protein GCM10022226_02440 [Sphaerisporangium flaviroseum]|uniref:Uncharacterized protein n=1 Tax=Sphaerisporangium flaviroseum TaxID=509199 RepID=A0ABP7H7M0_9ACTN
MLVLAAPLLARPTVPLLAAGVGIITAVLPGTALNLVTGLDHAGVEIDEGPPQPERLTLADA